MKTYDVIILGAGPAGLSLASVLSQNHKVCVIDKNKIGNTTKSWASYKKLIKRLKLENCIANDKIETLEFSHFLGAKWIFKDAYCQLNEQKILAEFIKRCNKTNTVFIEHTQITKISNKPGGVVVDANGIALSAKLLIDCSGADSPIIKKHNLIDSYSSYPILGYTMKNIECNPKKFIWEVVKTPGYKEIIIGGIMPYSSKVAQVHVFPYLSNKRANYSFLKKTLDQYVAYRELKHGKIISRSHGTILMGDLKQNALDNIFFFGESGLWTPRFIGTGFNVILRNYARVGNELNKLIKENRLSEQYLSKIKPVLQEKRILHLLKCLELLIFSLKTEPERLNEFLLKLNESHPHFGRYLMRHEYNAQVLKKSWKKIHEHFSVVELLSILPKKDILYLLELGVEILEDSLLKKYRKQLNEI